MSQPPKNTLRFFRWFCPDHLHESIEGDIIEQFEEDLLVLGSRSARWRFRFNVMRFFRYEIISRQQLQMRMINRALLFNNLKISLRNLRRHFAYSFINLMGLSLGIAVCLLIYNYTSHQLSYDSFHADIDKMYRVNQTAIWDPAGGMMGSTPPPLAQQLVENFPDVEAVLRINTPGGFEVRHHHETRGLLVFQEENVLATDSNFFEFFQLPLLAGDQQQALNGQHKVVITQEMAEKYFGTANALGQTLLFGPSQTPTLVSGVTKELPNNMHFDFDFLLSMPSNPNVKRFDWSWIWTQVATYAKIKPEASTKELATRVSAGLNEQIRSVMDRIGMDYKDFMKDKGSWGFEFQPVRDIHLHSLDTGNRIGSLGDIKAVNILQLLAFLILTMAVINFVNLSTARANIRSKEVGVKKTMGAPTSSLATQFQMESVVMTLIAGIFSIPFLIGLANLVTAQTGIDFTLSSLLTTGHISVSILILIGVGFLAGVYPSFYLSSFKPINILSSNKGSDKSGSKIRKILVTSQFAISLAFLSGSIFIGKQLQFLSQKNLGFDRENILVINHAEKLGSKVLAFRDEISQTSATLSASVSMDMPGRGSWEDLFKREGSPTKLAISQIKIDPYFFPTMNLELAHGRAFEKNRSIDHNHTIINETTARLFGWANEEAIDQHLIYPEFEPFKIIGVVKDFHFQSLHNDIRPLAFFHIESPMWGDQRVIAVKYKQKKLDELIAHITPLWNKFSDGIPFEYSVFDKELDRLYEQDQQLGSLVSLLTYLSIVIALLGLIGLISYTTEQRKKEIGIRKVLGASLPSIFMLINRQYLFLILLALVICIPFTAWMVNNWLEDFSFHLDLSWDVFVIAGLTMTLLSLLSVGYLAIKAALSNPIDAIEEA